MGREPGAGAQGYSPGFQQRRSWFATLIVFFLRLRSLMARVKVPRHFSGEGMESSPREAGLSSSRQSLLWPRSRAARASTSATVMLRPPGARGK